MDHKTNKKIINSKDNLEAWKTSPAQSLFFHHRSKAETMNTSHLKNTFLATLLGLSIPAYAASFDCKKASNKVEKFICLDPELSSQDEVLALAYKEALKLHPIPSYVKARQREWVELNQYCDSGIFTECLKDNYKVRISHLLATPKLTAYANTKEFIYTEGDMVAEYWPSNGKYSFSVWGGAVIHRDASKENGRPIYTECSFDGVVENIDDGLAISPEYNTKLSYRISGNTISFPGEIEICPGFARIPSTPLTRQR